LEYWYMLLFCGIVFVGFGAIILSSFDQAIMQPLYDSVNFANPFLMVLLIMGVVVVVGGWSAYQAQSQQRH